MCAQKKDRNKKKINFSEEIRIKANTRIRYVKQEVSLVRPVRLR